MEPKKYAEWLWADPDKLLQPHFDASRMSAEYYLKKQILYTK